MRRLALYGATITTLGLVMTIHPGARSQLSSYLFRDSQAVCACDSTEFTFRPSQGPPNSTHLHYLATCKQCGLQWDVVDVAWNDPRKVVDATLEAVTQAERDYPDE